MVLALVVLLAACDWSQYGYGASHTRSNPTETTIGVGNVGTLTTKWTATTRDMVLSSPAVAKGIVYVGSRDGKLYALDAAGTTNCSGTPKTCAPLWTANVGWSAVDSSPAVVNGVVYVVAGPYGETLSAFDAAGTTNCSGTPKTCLPLWTTPSFSTVGSSPTVANGVVYVAPLTACRHTTPTGTTNCSGTPKTCTPLWTAAGGAGSSPAVANGVVYVSSGSKLAAFSAAGTTNCSGTPKTCTPLWTTLTNSTGSFSSPAVENGVVYASSNLSYSDARLYAFSAAGTTNCSGTPKTCVPLWTTPSRSTAFSSPAVANGVVYVGSAGNGPSLYAFSATGTTNCSGTPKTCNPLWTADTLTAARVSPAVANGVVYLGAGYGNGGWLYAFSATGTTNCSGTPKTCNPLWISPTFGDDVISSPAVANGVVYAGSLDHKLYAFALPQR